MNSEFRFSHLKILLRSAYRNLRSNGVKCPSVKGQEQNPVFLTSLQSVCADSPGKGCPATALHACFVLVCFVWGGALQGSSGCPSTPGLLNSAAWDHKCLPHFILWLFKACPFHWRVGRQQIRGTLAYHTWYTINNSRTSMDLSLFKDLSILENKHSF